MSPLTGTQAPAPPAGSVALPVPASSAAGDAVGESDPQAGTPAPVHPSDILLELITCVLAPLFMAGCCGDLSGARLAAVETIASYQSRTQAELVRVSQIIAFGLAALDTLRLSMAADLSLSMTLRLRGCANALNRSAQQNAAALEKSRRRGPPQGPGVAGQAATVAAQAEPVPVEAGFTEGDLQAALAQLRVLAAQAQAQLQGTQPDASQPSAALSQAAEPATPELPARRQEAVPRASTPQADPHVPPPARTAASAARAAPAELRESVAGRATMPPSDRDAAAERQRLMWASAMGAVAGQLSDGLANAPAARRNAERMWANALGSHASSLAIAAGSAPPGSNSGVLRVDKKLKPA